MVGAILAIFAIFTGSVDTGWTFYTPYSTSTGGAVVMMTLAMFILGFSSIFTGLNFIVTIHKLRAPGMTWFKMPLFIWGIYATAIIQMLATPVLGITLDAAGVGAGVRHGNIRSRHGRRSGAFPAFLLVLFASGGLYNDTAGHGRLSANLFPSFRAREFSAIRPLRIRVLVSPLSAFWFGGTICLSAASRRLASMMFSFLTFLVAIPSGIKVFNWTATMYKGSISLKTPMLYALSFLFLFTIGGLTGLFLGALAVDVHVTDTYFVVAHFHYVMMGGTVMAFYRRPALLVAEDVRARCIASSGPGSALALVFIGFNITFMTQFILGSQGDAAPLL